MCTTFLFNVSSILVFTCKIRLEMLTMRLIYTASEGWESSGAVLVAVGVLHPDYEIPKESAELASVGV